jgi:phosphoribosylanthranilate isomerase
MSGRVRVKICGLTNADDAHAAIAGGADALGFNFFAGSKRCIDLEAEAGWIAALPPFVARVAVLVNAPIEEALRVARHPAIDAVQLHGDEDREYCEAFAECGRPFIKALRIAKSADASQAAEFSTPNVLIDASVPGAFGGTGRQLDLALAREIVERYPRLRVILAGGLTPENVREAARVVQPFAVDVASGVESNPRRKDAGRIAAFIRAVAV